MRIRAVLLSAAFACAALPGISLTPAFAQQSPNRDVFFGQTHVHTSWSFDAYIFGNTVTGPEDAYKYALGEAIKHPAGYMVQMKRPLDFQAVTDHSEYAGTIRLANEPGSAISKLPVAEKLKVKSQADIQRIYLWLGSTITKEEPIKELVSPEVAGTVWKEVVRIADKYYKPGTFTTFAAYEWTSTPANRNMHRNIIFLDSKKVPDLPFSSIDSTHPEDLWAWMDKQRAAGNELLAISHNANLSDGIMFPIDVDNKGRPIDAAWARQRILNEPLSEIQQLKGASETHPVLSPNDEFAGHEILNYLLGGIDRPPRIHGSYMREAWQNGLAFRGSLGHNPYKFGVVGASDSHNTAVSYTESNFFGGHGFMDATPQTRLSGKKEANLDMALLATSGLAGVWAEQNTRESIFAAMQRKETFGTSGVRIKVRLFGGWDFAANAMNQADWARTGYARGVPMGGDLPTPAGKAPTFMAWAVKDADGANLDRIQIIKGWTKSGQIFEKIYDVAWSGDRKPDQVTGRVPPVGNTVNIANASYTNGIGSVELKAVWSDPEFDPTLDAFYYARVLQIPTPRWTTIQAHQLGQVPPSNVPLTVQERAWTSPIWFTPTDEARRSAQRSVTVADLTRQGAVRLNDAQLKELIVGKTLKVRNTATGQIFEILYGTNGRRLILSIDGQQPEAGELGDVLHSGELGSPANYEIKDGRIITTLGNSPFDVFVYKLGDKHVAARSSEFGYANYEVTSASP